MGEREVLKWFLDQVKRARPREEQCVQQIAAASGERIETSAALVMKAEGRGVDVECICQAILIGYSIQEIESLLNKDNAAQVIYIILKYRIQPVEWVK